MAFLYTVKQANELHCHVSKSACNSARSDAIGQSLHSNNYTTMYAALQVPSASLLHQLLPLSESCP